MPGVTATTLGTGTAAAGTGPVVTLVLVVLIVMSVLTWAIVGYKLWLRRRQRGEEERFLAVFYEGRSLREIGAAAETAELSGAAQLFATVHEELRWLRERDRGTPAQLGLEGLNRIAERAIERALAQVRVERERYLTFLATTASGAPFIGLFGTVWGIMDAFAEIGRMGSASLAVVAPGISEALIATATGLFAAIPAAMAFNFFQRRLDEELAGLEAFRLELLNLLDAFVFPGLIGGEEGDGGGRGRST